MSIESTDRPRLAVFVDDPDLRVELRREASSRGYRVVTCFNFSDVWQTLMTNRHELAGLVVDPHHALAVASSSAAERVGRLPVILTQPGTEDLPFSMARTVRGNNVSWIVRAIAGRRKRSIKADARTYLA